MGRRQQTDGHRVMEWKEAKKVGFLLIKHGLTISDNYKEVRSDKKYLKRKLYISISKKRKFLNAKYWRWEVFMAIVLHVYAPCISTLLRVLSISASLN